MTFWKFLYEHVENFPLEGSFFSTSKSRFHERFFFREFYLFFMLQVSHGNKLSHQKKSKINFSSLFLIDFPYKAHFSENSNLNVDHWHKGLRSETLHSTSQNRKREEFSIKLFLWEIEKINFSSSKIDKINYVPSFSLKNLFKTENFFCTTFSELKVLYLV